MSPGVAPSRGCFEPSPQPRAALRAWDRRAAEDFGIPGLILMENAGEGCARAIAGRLGRPIAGDGGPPQRRWEPPCRVVCGPGNNGGDGFVIARHLHNFGLDVVVYLTHAGADYARSPEAALNLSVVRRLGIPVLGGGAAADNEATGAGALAAFHRAAAAGGVIVDALFGTGLARAVTSPAADWIQAINDSERPVVAVDLPSGLDADSGEVLGVAVRADLTLTMVCPKLGFSRGSGPSLVGRVEVVGISIPRILLRAGE